MKIFVTGLLVNFILYALLSVMLPGVRFDYIFVVLPFFLLVISYSLVRFLEVYVMGGHTVRDAIVVACILLLVGMVAPSFVSNAFIDGDRLNWRRGAQFLKECSSEEETGNNVVVYSPSPDYLTYYLGDESNRMSVKRLVDLGPETEEDRDGGELIVIPMRRTGLDFRGISWRVKRYILSNSYILQIIGNNRLDTHVNKLVIFRLLKMDINSTSATL
jgi:hypothetical protein